MTGFRRDQCRLDMGLLPPADAAVAFEHTLNELSDLLNDDHDWIAIIDEALAANRNSKEIS
ncbi:hypothetical protein ACFZC7_10890 [Streptomyces massasporeus]|uniref:hypothetical protein n=1 Tax=Streptomyces massasporeus TaxID=67324 RepID=UPI0036E7C291